MVQLLVWDDDNWAQTTCEITLYKDSENGSHCSPWMLPIKPPQWSGERWWCLILLQDLSQGIQQGTTSHSEWCSCWYGHGYPKRGCRIRRGQINYWNDNRYFSSGALHWKKWNHLNPVLPRPCLCNYLLCYILWLIHPEFILALGVFKALYNCN